jgi:2-keto-4-pentenoate hydratase
MGAFDDELARLLLQEHSAGTKFHPSGPETGVIDLASAYAVQRRFVALMSETAGATAGYKIGLTSARMQKMCGIDQPVAGVVLASRVAQSGVVLQTRRYHHMGLEFEVGVRLGRDLPRGKAPFTVERVAQAIDGICAAVEVVDDRNADYATLDALSLIADNSWNAGAVIGAFAGSWENLEAASGIVRLNGQEIDRGYGRDVLGHPFVPLTWLANHLAEAGGALKAGDVVLTGSLIPTRFPKEPGDYRFDLAGVGAVELTVEM